VTALTRAFRAKLRLTSDLYLILSNVIIADIVFADNSHRSGVLGARKLQCRWSARVVATSQSMRGGR